MSGEVQLVYGDEFGAYRLSASHPMQPIRLQLTYEQMGACQLLGDCLITAPRAATLDEIGLVHDRSYIETVRQLSEPQDFGPKLRAVGNRHGLGSSDNPIFAGMHQAAATIVGASIQAARAVHCGEVLHSFNVGGGYHHANRAAASGFCIYNDAAVAIAWLRAQGHRVAYVDVDVHHGDGTESIFDGDPEVLTISLHESGRYLFPGTGFPADCGASGAPQGAANLPFEPGTWDEPWLAGFEAVVPPLLHRFRPTILVTQDGCDTHVLDPLADLQCTTRIWPKVGARFHQLAHELCQGKWVALGGGGYAIREVVPRAWTLFFAEMLDKAENTADLLDPQMWAPPPTIADRVWSALEVDLGALSAAHLMPLHLP
ncbi:MAG TPA: acetoin utilization protein AcuC [Candidatus Dormibacteraeota bacterium]|jgi:acetoin utilization protein AcuC|nr:acetoin utilization protein AcuC [Candidatus Dormibacteraeota bacterium]